MTEQPFAMTVLGPVDPSELGTTLVHEHLHLDARPLLGTVHSYVPIGTSPVTIENAARVRWSPGLTPDNYDLTDIELIGDEIGAYAAAGGRTIVDVTPTNLGRSPEALKVLSERSGLNVVMGGGYYLAGSQPPDVRSASPDTLAREFIAAFVDGVGDTGVRPGILGELGTGATLDEAERRVLQAAAWTQAATGLPISIHLHPWSEIGDKVADVLASEGADLSRVVLGHLTPSAGNLPYLVDLFERGAYGAFDLFGFDHSLIQVGRYPPSDHDVAVTITELLSRGFARQVLVSHDIGVRTRFHRFGGWGYDHILTNVVPLLRTLGLSQDQLDLLLVGNPARMLTIQAAGS